MARLNDQDTRDAEHALRAEIALHLARYARRMLAQGKAHIVEDMAQAAKEGREIDGLTIGRSAAAKVRAEYFATVSKPELAIEAAATRKLETEYCDHRGDAQPGDPDGRKITTTRLDS